MTAIYDVQKVRQGDGIQVISSSPKMRIERRLRVGTFCVREIASGAFLMDQAYRLKGTALQVADYMNAKAAA